MSTKTIKLRFSAAQWKGEYESAKEVWDDVRKFLQDHLPTRWDIWMGVEAPMTVWNEKSLKSVWFLWVETRDQINVNTILTYSTV